MTPVKTLVTLVVAAALVVPLAEGGVAAAPPDPRIAALERAVVANPENLQVCADYRQQIIRSGEYDRAISLLERLSARRGSGPNVHVSLALAYVDKVPTATPFRRIFLGRDAMQAASRAIDLQPSLLAYFVRGLTALYYPESLFHKPRDGIKDLEQVRQMLPDLPLQPYHARVYVSLGDGYWKIHDLARAVSIWTEGLGLFPADASLRARLGAQGADRDRLVEHALDPATRVDTSLLELFPTGSSD